MAADIERATGVGHAGGSDIARLGGFWLARGPDRPGVADFFAAGYKGQILSFDSVCTERFAPAGRP